MNSFEPFLCERCGWNDIEKEKDIRYFEGKKTCKCCFDYVIKQGVEEILDKSYERYRGYLSPDGHRFNQEIAFKKLVEFIMEKIVGTKKEN